MPEIKITNTGPPISYTLLYYRISVTHIPEDNPYKILGKIRGTSKEQGELTASRGNRSYPHTQINNYTNTGGYGHPTYIASPT